MATDEKTIDTNRKGASANFLLKDVTLMFPSLFSTKLNTLNHRQEYQCAISIPKEHPQIAELKKEMTNLVKSFFTNEEIKSQRFSNFLKKPKEAKDFGTWGQNCAHFFNSKSQADQPPKVVGPDRKDLSDKSMASNNAKVNILISLYVYRRPTGVGITSYIKAVQIVEGGTRTVNVDNIFEDLSSNDISSEDFDIDSVGEDETVAAVVSEDNLTDEASEQMASDLWEEAKGDNLAPFFS